MSPPDQPRSERPPAAAGDAPISGVDAARPRTLFDRLGGRAVVERVVRGLYARIEADPLLRPIFPPDLAPGRERQAWYLEQWLGGESRYEARRGTPRLRQRHLPFAIDAAAAERWLDHLRAALAEAGVGKPLQGEILEGLTPLARHFVNRPGAEEGNER